MHNKAYSTYENWSICDLSFMSKYVFEHVAYKIMQEAYI